VYEREFCGEKKKDRVALIRGKIEENLTIEKKKSSGGERKKE